MSENSVDVGKRWSELLSGIHEQTGGTFYYIPETSEIGISRYVTNLGFKNDQEFIDFVNGNKILDSGSGFNQLAKGLKEKQPTTNVTSLNYRFAVKEFADIVDTKDSSVAAVAQKLPFADNTFDIILDNAGPTFYSVRGPVYEENDLPGYTFYHWDSDLEAFKVAMSEYLRVLKTGGKIRFGAYSEDLPDVEILEPFMKEMDLKYQKIEVENSQIEGVTRN